MQALAGAVVGIAAVRGAYKIGLRQVDIIEKQTDILAKQADIETKRLAHELYERRYKTYEASALYLMQCVNSTDLSVKPDTLADFLIVLGESQFLHTAGVTAGLKEILTKVEATYSLRRKMRSDYEENRVYTEGDPEKERELQGWLHERARTLPALFPDLVLS